MIDTVMLRKLGSAEKLESQEVLAEACLQAADTIDELCNELTKTIRVAADALKRAQK